jgi:hypothetical protein
MLGDVNELRSDNLTRDRTVANVIDQPILGSSLPPDVNGVIVGEVLLRVHCLEWIGEYQKLFQNLRILVSARWWGESRVSPSLIPPDSHTQEQIRNLSDVAIRFPVTCADETLHKYFNSNIRNISKVLTYAVFFRRESTTIECMR